MRQGLPHQAKQRVKRLYLYERVDNTIVLSLKKKEVSVVFSCWLELATYHLLQTSLRMRRASADVSKFFQTHWIVIDVPCCHGDRSSYGIGL
jgi:hypothetical protein